MIVSNTNGSVILTGPKLKTCSKCKVEQDIQNFSKNKKCKGGHLTVCKNCCKIYEQNNKEKRQYRSKKYYQENKKEVNKRSRIWAEKNREKVNEKAKKYRNKHKEKIQIERKIRARKSEYRYAVMINKHRKGFKSTPISFGAWTEIISKNCHYCKNILPEVGYGLDRICPVEGYTEQNVVPCCTICNKIKNKYNISFLKEHLQKMLDVIKEM